MSQPAKKAEAGPGAVVKMALFLFFILTRALHPLLIDMSKVDGKILYAKNTPVVMNKILTVTTMNLVALIVGGRAGLRQCWQPRSLAVFGLIGIFYAVGDFLEMLSMSKLSGGVYQVLLQAKLLITACMMWYVKGTGQSAMQWHVLFAMFLAMSAFVLVEQGGSGDEGGLPIMAMLTVIFKVFVSCYCAVLSEKYLKAFADLPVYAKISGLSTTWAVVSILLCLTEPQVAENGFFTNWDNVTWLVTFSFVVKTVSTMYLLQILDSLQKNIGEALAVIVIYVAQVFMAGFAEHFELSVFFLALLVVALVKTYLITPKAGGKAVKREAKNTTLVSLKSAAGTALSSAGMSTMTAEVQGALPAGVFYGMLGGVHPVCVRAEPSRPKHCDLTFLAQPAANSIGGARPFEPPYLPSQSLTLLGQLRGHSGELSVERAVQDVNDARARLLDGFSIAMPADEP